MTPTSNTIVFFGSGPVAAEALQLLAQSFVIEAVVTKPRPPHHKGDVPVLRIAEKLGLAIHTVATRSALDDLIALRPFKSSVGILIDFGIIVSQSVIDYFPFGIINSHFSILPEWRGADPISFAVASGQASTGVSLMLLVAAMDEGPLLSHGEYELPPGITTPRLTEQLIKLSHALLEHAVPRYLTGAITARPQTITGRAVSYSRKLSKSDSRLDFTKPAVQLEREIRAFADWPKSRTDIAGLHVIVTGAHVVTAAPAHTTPGTLHITAKPASIIITCGESALALDRVKPAGKSDMDIRSFLAGYGHLLPPA